MTVLVNNIALSNQAHYLKVVAVANRIMMISLLIFFGCLMASYGFERHISLAAQIAAHLLTIASAAVFKLGYATRCVGAFNLGHKAF